MKTAQPGEETAQVELHSLYLSDELPVPNSILSEAEKSRAAAFRSCSARRLFVAGRVLCRSIIANLLGCAPQALCLAITPSGRPHLRDYPDIDFNLSHTKDHIALAICRGGRIGIDIERLDAFSEKEASEIMPMILSEQELNQVQQLERRQRHDVFLACWVQKEAALKCFGHGFLADPQGVMLMPGNTTFESKSRISDEAIFIRSGRISNGESGDFQWAIATSRATARPEWQHHKSGIFF
ncbi:4'-phosphopantetheinyl transferase [Rhizobium sp. ERR 922]|uniref:4'-phosphopantetheinyl transferase family protein n=1 Tax=unclassified Rhizobium TaxID=2613769 RepID=UPI00119CE997|nr:MULTISPECIES: 4'-phosphopantetheinyl transferase superfamily protein [unclassified Rhizobium]TWB46751.1 4'-phosphopantetheinyl transferase [Rhizobium sp. ERR 922]TWB89134.1 4'-phosphopantetheinyl transferase [Rhizobium sp. ERR 942]